MTLQPALAAYLGELVALIDGVAELEAAYLIGSAASGAYEESRSDVDVYAVTAERLAGATKQELVGRVEALECPARKLELVIYSRAEAALPEPRFETGEWISKPEAAAWLRGGVRTTLEKAR